MNIDIATGSLLLAVVGAALGLWWRIEAQVTEERQERQSEIQRLTAEIELSRGRFGAFELEVIRNFVPASYQEKMETRFLSSIDKLASRLEMVVTRIEGLSNELIKIKTVITKVEQVVGVGITSHD